MMTKALTLSLFGVLLGAFTVILLPILFAMLLDHYIIATREPVPSEPVRCDGGDESEPADAAQIVAELLQAAKADADRRQALEDAPIPDCFEAWIREHGLK